MERGKDFRHGYEMPIMATLAMLARNSSFLLGFKTICIIPGYRYLPTIMEISDRQSQQRPSALRVIADTLSTGNQQVARVESNDVPYFDLNWPEEIRTMTHAKTTNHGSR